jgi:protein-S-isoprenylcysteine O-methyltransferase Ste14
VVVQYRYRFGGLAQLTMLTVNLFIAITSVAVLAMLTVRMPKEVQMLIERFGQQYRNYIATTGSFTPRIGR